MALLLYSSPSQLLTRRFAPSPLFPSSSSNKKTRGKSRSSITRAGCQAFFSPFEDQPIIKDALKEPMAFMGGVFAGLLRLDLNEDPLKEWVSMTVKASGMSPEELAVNAQDSGAGGEEDEAPWLIEIE